MLKSLAIALIIIALIIGIGIGYVITPWYSMSRYENKQMADLGEPDRYIDLRYIDAMIAHHLSAMKLANQAKNNSKRSEITALAGEILKNEPAAIDELYSWKEEWYGNKTSVNAGDVPNLGSYDDKFDLRFLNALIAHHEEGIKMTEEIRHKSTRLEVLNNADAVEDFLKNGIKMLGQWRAEWYR
jgi:uncharacterized protein (DUF305 family)